MFQMRYVASELRRRAGRTILTALGLAAGVGLVIGIIGVSQGLNDAQTKVLSPLSKIGTDVLVTRVAAATPTDAPTTTSTTAAQNGFRQGGGGGANALAACGAGGGGFFGAGGGPGGGGGGNANANTSTLNTKDCTDLLADNDSVLTDLSKLGPAGTHFEHDFFLPATLLTFPDAALSTVSKLDGVASATPGLTLIAQHESGTVPNQVVNVTTNQQTITQTVRPAPMTDAERQAFQACLQQQGADFTGGANNRAGGTTATTAGGGGGGNGGPPEGDGGGGGGGFRRFDNGAFQNCLPERFKEFQNNVIIPAQQIQRIVNPPQTDTTNSSYTVAGVDPNSPNSGLVTVDQVKKGAFLKPGANDTVLLSVAYANKKSLDVGSTLTVNGAKYNVVGLVDPALTGSTADVYFTLPKLQELSSKSGRINQVLVKAKSSADVDKVAAEISKAIPGAQVVTTKALSKQVTGSLADAKKLADKLGGALAVIVLAAVFAIAMLLTLSSVAKRIREIGTLRAIGWSKGMVVRQMLSETIGIGILGGILGILFGLGVAALVRVSSIGLDATSTGVPSFGSSQLSGLFRSTAAQAQTVKQTVHLTAPVHLSTLAIGVVFAILGGILAGAVGGWRAARLAPAEALRNVG